MTAEQFAYWLQGFAELTDGAPTPEQWQSVCDHLQTVFVKVTPNAFPQMLRPGLGPLSPDALTRTIC